MQRDDVNSLQVPSAVRELQSAAAHCQLEWSLQHEHPALLEYAPTPTGRPRAPPLMRQLRSLQHEHFRGPAWVRAIPE